MEFTRIVNHDQNLSDTVGLFQKPGPLIAHLKNAFILVDENLKGAIIPLLKRVGTRRLSRFESRNPEGFPTALNRFSCGSYTASTWNQAHYRTCFADATFALALPIMQKENVHK